MKNFFAIIALGTVALLSADQNYQSTCPNCPNYRPPEYPRIVNQDPGFDEQFKRQGSADSTQGYNPSNDGYYDTKKNSQASSDMQKQNAENKFPMDTASTAQDRQINTKIRDTLNGGWFSKGNPSLVLRTNNGVVTISGNVEKAEDAQKIIDQIKEVDGVRSVNSHLIVRKR